MFCVGVEPPVARPIYALERVIVVSHHDDFRDRLLFPSCYMISRTGDATRVERLM